MTRAIYAFGAFSASIVLFALVYKLTFELDGRSVPRSTWREAFYQSVMTQTATGLPVPVEERHTNTANMLQCIVAYAIVGGFLFSASQK